MILLVDEVYVHPLQLNHSIHGKYNNFLTKPLNHITETQDRGSSDKCKFDASKLFEFGSKRSLQQSTSIQISEPDEEVMVVLVVQFYRFVSFVFRPSCHFKPCSKRARSDFCLDLKCHPTPQRLAIDQTSVLPDENIKNP